MSEVTVDFISNNEDESVWGLVLVEQGPWNTDETSDELSRLQSRLYGCIDAIIDGKVAEVYPGSLGKAFVIQLDGYDLPEDVVSTFFASYSQSVLEIPDYKQALESNMYVKAIEFEINLSELPKST